MLSGIRVPFPCSSSHSSMIDLNGADPGELSGYGDQSSFISNQANGTTNTNPLDLVGLADFEDEAALINELLASSESNGLVETHESFTLGTTGTASRQDGEDGVMSLLELDTKLSRLLGVLDHACQDTSAQVERAIEDVSRSVPRLTFDLQLMRENVILLRFTLDSIRKRSLEATAHSETLQVMRRLKVLDTIKTRMEAARDVLREAEAWSSLESEVTSLVQEQAYVKAAERLAEANKSMVVFQNTPEFEARRSLMVSLQNGLEAGLSASLVAAINARDVEACKNYYGIFGQIQRETEFRNYYFGSRRANLLQNWQATRLQDCLTSHSQEQEQYADQPVSFSTYLPSFYNAVQTTVNDERTYIPAIFPDPLDTLSSFLQTTLDSLVPSLPQRISDLSNYHGPQLLLELIKIYHATEEFAVAVDRIFTRLAVAIAPPPTSSPSPGHQPPSTPGHATSASVLHAPASGPLQRVRRQSKAMSISRRHSRGGPSMFGNSLMYGPSHGLQATGVPQAAELEPIRAWETSLFEPFLDWQAEYADLESRLLRSELSKIANGQDAMAYLLSGSSSSGATENGQDDDDAAASMNEQAKGAAKMLLEQTLAVFALAEEALGRTMAFTHGYGAAGYVEAVDGTFQNFLLKERDTLLRAKDVRLRRRKAGGGHAKPPISDAGEDHHLEYSQDDWATFQLALRLLETCRTIYQKISALEGKVRSRLIDIARLLQEARSDPSNQLVPGTTRGALALLWQSTLNSASLNSLLEAIEPTPSSHSHPASAPSLSPPPALFTQARLAALDLTKAAQLFLHDTILAPILETLSGYSSLPVWSTSTESRSDSKGAFDLRIPTFSLSPSEIITKVGEGFLNLPGMFEAYAEDDALGFSLETLPALDEETIQQLRKEQVQFTASPQPSPHLLGNHRHRSNMSLAGNEFLPADSQSPLAPPRISPTLSTHSSYTMSQPSTGPHQQPPQVLSSHLSAEVVISTWLNSLTRSVLLHLTNDILPSIRYLSRHGAEQLASDLGYLSNVARALDVEVEQVEKWRNALEIVEGGSAPAADTQSQEAEGEQTEVAVEDNELVDVVKRMRIRPSLAKRDR